MADPGAEGVGPASPIARILSLRAGLDRRPLPTLVAGEKNIDKSSA